MSWQIEVKKKKKKSVLHILKISKNFFKNVLKGFSPMNLKFSEIEGFQNSCLEIVVAMKTLDIKII